MTVRVERRTRDGRARWVADIRVRLPNGLLKRERRDVPGNPTSKRAAMKWATARERELIRHGVEDRKKQAPTIAAFAEDFLRHSVAKGRKPSTVQNHRTNLKHHVLPMLGRVRVDEVEQVHVSRIYGIERVSIGTKNKIAATLSALLTSAIELGHMSERDKPRIRHLRTPRTTAPFLTRPQFEDLVLAARQLGPIYTAIVLLAGEAGLRAGEIRGLHWRSVNLEGQFLIIEHSEWNGQIVTPKSNRFRRVSVSRRIVDALKNLERIGQTVLARDDGSFVSTTWLSRRLHKAQDRAGQDRTGPHMLRHTFCSLLASEGATAAQIRKLAGHSSVAITDRYMHLSPGEDVTAIRLLEKASERELAKRESAPRRGAGKQGERSRKASKKRKKNN